jgi:hypothetical protein
MDILKDSTGTYSIRKFGGYAAIILLVYLVISFTIATDFKIEIPTAYWGAIYLIIVFYFFKDTIRKARIGTTDINSDSINK